MDLAIIVEGVRRILRNGKRDRAHLNPVVGDALGPQIRVSGFFDVFDRERMPAGIEIERLGRAANEREPGIETTVDDIRLGVVVYDIEDVLSRWMET
jgi:hypothetical protein